MTEHHSLSGHVPTPDMKWWKCLRAGWWKTQRNAPQLAGRARIRSGRKTSWVWKIVWVPETCRAAQTSFGKNFEDRMDKASRGMWQLDIRTFCGAHLLPFSPLMRNHKPYFCQGFVFVFVFAISLNLKCLLIGHLFVVSYLIFQNKKWPSQWVSDSVWTAKNIRQNHTHRKLSLLEFK